MEMMRAAVFYGKNDIRLEYIPRPAIGYGELLVNVKVAGLCGSDLDKIQTENIARGSILGHEVAGVVAEVGKGVNNFRVGDRVALAHHVSCQACHYCDSGSDSMCQLFRDTNFDPGGFAEYIRVPQPNVKYATFQIPQDVPFEQAIFLEPLGCCIRAMNRSPLQPGHTLLIIGLGSIGLLFVQLAKLRQVNVIALDLIDERLELAKSLGADIIINPTKESTAKIVQAATDNRGADMILTTISSQSVLDQALEFVRNGGIIHFFAGKRKGVIATLDLNQIYEREISILTTYSSSPRALRESFRLIKEKRIRTAELIGHRLPLTDILKGVTMMANHETIKVYFEL